MKFSSDHSRIDSRSNWPYYPPINCKRYGVKVEDMFDKKDNTWLNMINCEG